MSKSSLNKVLSELPFKIVYKPHISELYEINSYIAKDEKIDLLKISIENDIDIDLVASTLEKLITVDIEYQSLYGEKSVFHFRNGQHA